jgi:2-polyprenyl-3-methyl-5-hydroxy-6-metoxy-1,4-benzoquinol methylase
MPEQTYPGTELDLFARALNWKRYLRRMLAGYLQGRVLEVGAGIGATTCVLCENHHGEWVCLEPDPELSARACVPSGVTWKRGNLIDIPAFELFDCILYMDVLEHIADDRLELERARDHLNANGVIVVAAPAHQSLYSPFDASIGHYRRYDKETIRQASPEGVVIETLRYMDAAGLLASAGNRVLLRQSDPSLKQVLFWDRVLVPCSRVLDRLLGYRIGKSILAVWRRAP